MHNKKFKKRSLLFSIVIAYCAFLISVILVTVLYNTFFYFRSLEDFPDIIPLFLSFLLANIILWRLFGRLHPLLWGMIIFTVVLVRMSFLLYYIGWFEKVVEYNVALIKCWHQPVIADDFMGYSYVKPGDSRYEAGGGIFDTAYFCTERDAQKAGFAKDVKSIW